MAMNKLFLRLSLMLAFAFLVACSPASNAVPYNDTADAVAAVDTADAMIAGSEAAGETEAMTQVISPTCVSEGYRGTQLTWCKNICENGLTGDVLDTWIHRWVNRYRQLPYCVAD